MIAALTLLLLAGTTPSGHSDVRAPMVARAQSAASNRAPVTPPALTPERPAPAAPPVARVRPPTFAAGTLDTIDPPLREAVVCAAHMELLMERLSARGQDAEAPVILIEEYWQTKLPDPDGPDPVPVATFVTIKDRLDASASETPSQYLRGLQDCVISAARGGALSD
ncbi:hypothetical protein [Brevundimonas terrae]|uniref:hypothetical protein n=1 Tax=Brevundimonas terrae TaxID=363631 RepID=UPI001421B8B8|nr:hypothetical protein [Brevundimonas terrae]NIJ27548.1 hypothetical protein [Brevundimonas terrae]